jgi:hypothetical protein
VGRCFLADDLDINVLFVMAIIVTAGCIGQIFGTEEQVPDRTPSD